LPNGHPADRFVYSIFWREWQRRMGGEREARKAPLAAR